MSLRPSRIAVPGLREADPTSILIMIQDIMSRSVHHLDAGTLADLFALAELGEQLPKHLQRDLDRIARGMERQLEDLPDGQPIQEQLALLAEVPPAHVCERLRRAVTGLQQGRQLEPGTSAMIADLEERWAAIEPVAPTPGRAGSAQVERPAVPKRLRMPDDPSPRRRSRIGAPVKKAPLPATPAAKQDEGRATWIRQHVLERLDARREQGLKESILVAAACHNSPYSDLQRGEVLAELRELKKEGTVKNSAGRWIRVQRLGW